MPVKTETKTGLFLVSYEIGGQMPGQPFFSLNLSVFTPGETVSGIGHIKQTTNPELDMGTSLSSHYTYMCVMPDTCHILISATGYPVIKWPQGAGIGPVIPPNTELRMVLKDDWQSGVATYKYIDNMSTWQEIKDVPVKAVHGKSISGE